MRFTEKDTEQYVEALNYIATNARFSNVDSVKGSIELYKHFSFLQNLAQKIDSNIMEFKSIEQVKPEKPKPKKGKKK